MAVNAAASTPSDWHALYRLADSVGTLENPATQIRGRHPQQEAVDNGGAQALCHHDDDFEGVVLSDGSQYTLLDD